MNALDFEAGLGPANGTLKLGSPDEHKIPESQQTVVTFRHCTYSVRTRRRRLLKLISGISGALMPQEMTAILGPSGSGKSTLLDVLAGRKTAGMAPDSEVLYNGRPATEDFLRRHVGYVEQQDTLLGMLSPFEMLLYTAELKHSRWQPHAEKRKQVATLIERLGLQDCQDTVIGSRMQRGISGGEAKRVNIGIALIGTPSVLYLDEVTSGLDSYNAHGVVTVVKDLTSGGIAVAAAIHSPPPYTFALFNRAMVLQRGRVVYWGLNGDPAFEYLARTFPELRPKQPSEGLADYLIDLTTKASLEEQATSSFADGYESSELAQQNAKEIGDLVLHAQRQQEAQQVQGGDGTPSVPWWWALCILWQYRSLRAFKRFDFFVSRMMTLYFATFILVTLYWGIGKDLSPENVTPIAGVLFMWALSAAFGTMMLLHLVVLERPAYNRERSDGLYSPAIYLAYKVSEELLAAALVSVPACLLLFYLVRLQGSFLLFWAVYLCSISISIVLALLCGAVSRNVDTAGALLPSYTTSLLYFAGFLIPYPLIPRYWQWYAIINNIRYGWGALMINQFEGDRNVVAYGGQHVLNYYGLSGKSKWGWLGFEAIFILVFLVMTWAALAFIKHQRR